MLSQREVVVPKSFGLTPDQIATLTAMQKQPAREVTGMAKWEIQFTSGKTCTMLSDQCHDQEAAFLAAVERFGPQVKAVW